MKIDVDMTEVYKGLDKLSDKTKKAAEGAIKDTVVNIANDAIAHSPHKYGHNKQSIKYQARGLSGSIYTTSGYGGYLETGTGIFGPRGQMITPKRAKMLVWEDKSGNLIFAKAVRGRPATPYLKPALDRQFPKFAKIMKEKMRRW